MPFGMSVKPKAGAEGFRHKITVAVVMEREQLRAFCAILLGMFSAGASSAFLFFGSLHQCFHEVSPVIVVSSLTAFAVGLLAAHSLCVRLGFKRMGVMGALLVSLPLIARAFIGGETVIMLLLVVAVGGFGLLFSLFYTLGAGWFPRHLALSVGAMLSVFFFAGVIFPPLHAFLQTALGAGGLFVLALLYSFPLAVALSLMQRSPAATRELALKYGVGMTFFPRQLLKLGLILLTVGVALLPVLIHSDGLWHSQSLTAFADGNFIPVEIARETLAEGRVLLVIAAVSPAFGALCWGAFVHLQEQEWEKRGMVFLGVALASLAVVALFCVANFYAVATLLAFLGFCWGGINSVIFAMAGRNFYHHEMMWVSGLLMGTNVLAAIFAGGIFRALPKTTAHFLTDPANPTSAVMLEIVPNKIIYGGALGLCLCLLFLVFFWKDYDEKRKSKTLVS